jgi:riboflavin kinase
MQLADGQQSADNSLLPIRFTSVTTKGFGRGSKELGIPTANLDATKTETHPHIEFEDLPCGIYWGFCRIGKEKNEDDEDDIDASVVYATRTAAISIGFNPTYGNDKKTVEPHLIAPSNHERRHASKCGETVFQDFYNLPLRMSILGYLRPELPFEGIDKLIAAIKKDIAQAERHAESTDEAVAREKAWVDSEKSVAEFE